MKSKLGFWIVFLLSLILLFAPISVGGRDGFGLDKVVHGLIFLLLAFLSLKSFPQKKILSIVLLLVYAFLTEYIQGEYLPLRHFDWYDIISDTTGLVLGTVIYIYQFYGIGKWNGWKKDEKKS